MITIVSRSLFHELGLISDPQDAGSIPTGPDRSEQAKTIELLCEAGVFSGTPADMLYIKKQRSFSF